jgi:hypothetical protein
MHPPVMQHAMNSHLHILVGIDQTADEIVGSWSSPEIGFGKRGWVRCGGERVRVRVRLGTYGAGEREAHGDPLAVQ